MRDPVLRDRIGELMRRAWEQHGREHSEGRLSPELLADVDRGATGSISAAPVLVVVAADTARCLPATVPSSIFPALQNLLLAAGALGLGSALTTIATAFADELRRGRAAGVGRAGRGRAARRPREAARPVPARALRRPHPPRPLRLPLETHPAPTLFVRWSWEPFGTTADGWRG